MSACAACATENPEAARFCMSCGAPLEAEADRREERKVVTVLFADLVGFTSRAEQLDVEEVRETLEPYHAALRRVLEQFGGTVEKFIGDAVMAVFGAPIAREDDAERAVRAALEIRDAVTALERGLTVRVGVNTGEALAVIGAHPERGEGIVSGDVVNTAARLQSLAPAGAVLVAEATYRATARMIRYEAQRAVVAKGKADPVACWLALEPRSRLPQDVRASTPFVGRAREWRLLTEAFERCREEGSAQLIAIVGVPGIGKSRLVEELRAHLEALPESITWRQGRSLSYGEGVGFWAVGEIVKQQTGILESDGAAEAAGKLDAAIAAVGLEEADAVLVRRQLGALVGVEADGQRSTQEEAFAAWRIFLEAVAAERELVTVFEDLQWAEPPLLDFVESLPDRLSSSRLLVVCTARPELWGRRPGWAGGKPNAMTISLQPLSEAESREMVGGLDDAPRLSEDELNQLLARAAGNPLFAHEYVRMLAERRGGEAPPLPDSVQGIIAARLDGLSSDEKSVLQDAAVIGRSSWVGALCALGGRETSVVGALVQGLERKQLVQRLRRSTVAGETELSFTHDLVRDVAYAQLTRSQRADRHQRAAGWVEELAGDRDDRAELVAHHLTTALQLRQALGDDVTALQQRTLHALVAASRQSAMRDPTATLAFVERALTLEPDERTRAELLVRRALQLRRLGIRSEAELLEARQAALDAGDREGAVEVAGVLALWAIHDSGDQSLVDRYSAEGLELAASLPPTPLTMSPATAHAFRLEVQGRFADAIVFLEDQLERARAAGSDEAVGLLLERLGASRCNCGDMSGIDDLRDAYRLLSSHAHPRSAGSAVNLAEALFQVGRMDDSRAMNDEGLAWARRFGDRVSERYALAALACHAYHAGDIAEAGRLLDLGERLSEDPFTGAWLLLNRARVSLDTASERAGAYAEEALRQGEKTGNEEVRMQALALLARAQLAQVDAAGCRSTCDRFLAKWRAAGRSEYLVIALAELALVLAADGRHADLGGAIALLSVDTPWAAAVQALADARYEEAAAAFGRLPSIPLRDAARALETATRAALLDA